MILGLPSYASPGCSTRILKKICDVCEERALSKLNTDSVCPVCPEVNCPQVSYACIKTDTFVPLLKESYTLSATLDNDGLLLKLNFKKNEDSPTTLKYDVRSQNFRTLVSNAIAFIFYDLINFNVPLQLKDSLFSYNCLGVINNTSTISGLCSTLANDENNQPKYYGFQFTAIPNDSPIK